MHVTDLGVSAALPGELEIRHAEGSVPHSASTLAEQLAPFSRALINASNLPEIGDIGIAP